MKGRLQPDSSLTASIHPPAHTPRVTVTRQKSRCVCELNASQRGRGDLNHRSVCQTAPLLDLWEIIIQRTGVGHRGGR